MCRLQAARLGIKEQKYRDFAIGQIDLMLGDWGRSFICGFGVDPPVRPHHRSSYNKHSQQIIRNHQV